MKWGGYRVCIVLSSKERSLGPSVLKNYLFWLSHQPLPGETWCEPSYLDRWKCAAGEAAGVRDGRQNS